jgi:hypothetical protein
MADVATEGVAEARSLELAKLDSRERYLLGVMSREHLKVDRGRVGMCRSRYLRRQWP